jgi:hypothetical protein
MLDKPEPLISRSEAKIKGLRYYRTGRSCLHGHIAQRLTKSAACTACEAERHDRFYARFAPRPA